MKHFLDILRENYNFTKEIERIAILFNSELLYTVSTTYLGERKQFYSLESIFNDKLFSDWKGRLSCISIKDLKNTLGIKYNNCGLPIINGDDDIIKYLEYYVNISSVFAKSNCSSNYNKTSNYKILADNIFMLLDHMNHQIIEDKENRVYIIIPRNPQAISVAEISNSNTALAVLQYNHRTLKGKLNEKSKILATIANEYEDILKKAPDGHKELFDKTRGLCNQLCIRHTNADNKCNIAKMTDRELEQWYDNLYQMLLLCILIDENIKQKRVEHAKELLAGFNKK